MIGRGMRESKSNRELRICKGCGNEFYVWPSQAKRGRGKFCTRSCMKRMVYRECKFCGDEFLVSRRATREVCGKGCPALRIEYDCIVCATTVSRPRCFGEGKFCTNRCYNNWVRDNDISFEKRHGLNRKIKNKRKRRIANGDLINSLDVFEFFDWTCIVCDEIIDKTLEFPHKMSATLEHIIPFNMDGTHTWDNVAPSHLLCNSRKGGDIDPLVVDRHREMYEQRGGHYEVGA